MFVYLTEDEKVDATDTFFVKVREELDIIPAQVRVLEYMQEKATFKTQGGGRTIKAAQLIKHPVPKAMGNVNLMAYVIISKYADGMPLYRLENIIKRYAGEISRATLANWVIAPSKHVMGRNIRADKAGANNSAQNPILSRLGLSEEQRITLTTEFEQQFCYAAGAEQMMQEFKTHTHRKRIGGMKQAKRLLS